MTEALSISAVRCDTKTHWKLTMKELQGQTRTSKLVCLLPSFSSFSFSESLVILFLLLSTYSWSRVKQSWSQRVLQSGAAGNDLIAASLGSSRAFHSAELCPLHRIPGRDNSRL